jgi:hypothetical protein
MLGYNKRTFVLVELVTCAVSWMVYVCSNNRLAPVALFFLAMQINAAFCVVLAGPSRRKMHGATSIWMN